MIKLQKIATGSGEAAGRSSRIRISVFGSIGHCEYDAGIEGRSSSIEQSSEDILRSFVLWC